MSSAKLLSSLRPRRDDSTTPSSSATLVVEPHQHQPQTPQMPSQTPSTTASSRKRPRPFRRPPPLLVPVRPPTSLPTSFYDHPTTDIPLHPSESHLQTNPDPLAAAHSRRGLRRRSNEDRVFSDSSLQLYGVCDGHGGEDASNLVATRFPILFSQMKSLAAAFHAVDAEVCAAQRKPSFVGTTLTAALVDPGRLIKVAHVGDSRAMLIDKEGRAITLTRDHSPNRPDEVRRIEKAGGAVLHGRVNGVLAVSRAVGDTALKNVVVAEPEEVEYALGADEQLLVLATDGLWDLISDSEVAAFLRARPVTKGSIAVPRDLKEAAEGLVDLAVKRGSKDDTSVVLVDIRRGL